MHSPTSGRNPQEENSRTLHAGVRPSLVEEERVVPGRLGGDLWRRLAALLAADPLEGVRREDDRRRPRRELAVPVLPRCNERERCKGQF